MRSPCSRLKSYLPCLLSTFILGFPVPILAQTFQLSSVEVLGTDRLSGDEVARGLGLSIGGPVTLARIEQACDRLKQLRLFDSTNCRYRKDGQDISLTILVEEAVVFPIVFDNIVWIPRDELLTRLKREIPLFTVEMPLYSGLNKEIVRVLEESLDEEGIQAPVRYDDSFYTLRGINVFYVQGVSTLIASVGFVGATQPSQQELDEIANALVGRRFSAARAGFFYARSILENLYHSRGYPEARIVEVGFEYLGPKDGTHPVRLIFRIDETPQP